LLAKPWFVWAEQHRAFLRPGSVLTFELFTETRELQLDGRAASRSATGTITTVTSANEVVKIGEVSFACDQSSIGDPVVAYLKRHGAPVVSDGRNFEHGGYVIGGVDGQLLQAPSNLRPYSEASTDWNPIHSNVYFAKMANHEAPIVHGMWTSAAARKLVEVFAAENVPSRIVKWKAEFLSAVKFAEILKVGLKHIGMKGGRLLVATTVTASDGRVVLKGIAEVEQPPTVYVFTGQGSQVQGMGMDLYVSR
jgi:fatty acid synthase subunit alpha